jgi:quercetin dioxygenase-like cupin family protein
MSDRPTDASRHHAPVVRRPDEYPPEMGRFRNMTQMVFHPTETAPDEPNAGIITYLPGAGFPRHAHDFAQVWYVLDGECSFGDRTLRAGDMLYMADPHFEHEMRTETGCRILFVQYPGPATGARPIYAGRFNQASAPKPEEQDLKR